MINLNDQYQSNLNRAKKFIVDNDFFRIFSHYDADGISSAVIISKSLRTLGKKFHLSFIGYEDKADVDASGESPLILSDLGAELIDGRKASSALLIDHHMISDQVSGEIINLNPREYGYDGTREACSSTVAFILALNLDEMNSDLFPFFMTGVIGDKQNIDGFNGLNAALVDSFKDRYAAKKNLKLFGETVSEAISLSTEPYFEGLSGNLERSIEFVKKVSIDPESTLIDLGSNDKEKLADALTLRLLKQNVSAEGVDALVGEEFSFAELGGISAGQLSDYLDASGRNGRMGLPVSWYMGNEDAMEEMHKIWQGYRKDVLSQVEKAKKSMKTLRNINVVYEENPSMTGVVAGIVMVYLSDKERPVVAMCRNRSIKVSGRATRGLVSKGLNLSKAISEATLKAGGHGGGHDIAAGGEIPLDREDSFLTILDSLIGDQIGNTEKSS
jgi:single-stranded DNA-specific DHH superfamily exonuclease